MHECRQSQVASDRCGRIACRTWRGGSSGGCAGSAPPSPHPQGGSMAMRRHACPTASVAGAVTVRGFALRGALRQANSAEPYGSGQNQQRQVVPQAVHRAGQPPGRAGGARCRGRRAGSNRPCQRRPVRRYENGVRVGNSTTAQWPVPEAVRPTAGDGRGTT